jgi:vancomycin resistance protein VanJ
MKLLKWIGIAARAAVCVYGGSIALLLILRAFTGDRFLPTLIFDMAVPAILFPGLVLLIFYALTRHWRMATVQLPALACFLWMYGHVLLPSQTVEAPTGTQISVLTYNISLGRRHPEERVEVILEANADVVALQEVSTASAEYFETELADIYPYSAVHAGSSPPGQAVYSKYPILEDSVWEVERMHQRVVLDVNGQNVTFYNVHPVHFDMRRDGTVNFDDQLREVDDILSRTAEETNPMLIVGDFNTTDQSGIYDSFADLYGDAFGEVGSGFGFTFPSNLPLARLDYVFYTSEFTPLSAQVWDSSGGSDHHPVYAQLELANPVTEADANSN